MNDEKMTIIVTVTSYNGDFESTMRELLERFSLESQDVSE